MWSATVPGNALSEVGLFVVKLTALLAELRTHERQAAEEEWGNGWSGARSILMA